MEYLKVLEGKIFTAEIFERFREALRLKNKRIVFTNGCFDILHYGHIQYLAKAKDLGDYLVVGINTDASVKLQQKNPSRPLQDEHSRSLIMASLHVVDAVILFDELTPSELIKKIIPDVLVKGADYSDITKIAGYDTVIANGGTVSTIEFAEGYSTTAIEKRSGKENNLLPIGL